MTQNIFNTFLFQKGISDETVSVMNGRIDCTFTRQASTNNDDMYFDLSGDNEYTIIMARSSSGSLGSDGKRMKGKNGRAGGECFVCNLIDNNYYVPSSFRSLCETKGGSFGSGGTYIWK